MSLSSSLELSELLLSGSLELLLLLLSDLFWRLRSKELSRTSCVLGGTLLELLDSVLELLELLPESELEVEVLLLSESSVLLLLSESFALLLLLSGVRWRRVSRRLLLPHCDECWLSLFCRFAGRPPPPS